MKIFDVYADDEMKCLFSKGIHSKKEVIELINSRYGLRRIRNIGYALEKEIQDWVNT